MRAIKQVDVVCATGAKSYSIGQEVNGLVIAKFEFWSNEGLTEITARDTAGQLVVNVVNCPVVLKYAEVLP